MSDETTIPPALTHDEWEALAYDRPDFFAFIGHIQGGMHVWHPGNMATPLDSVDRSALAALCLYGQPFGFTQEDATLMRVLAEDMVLNPAASLYPETVAHALHLAAKIAALLPKPAPEASAPPALPQSSDDFPLTWEPSPTTEDPNVREQ